MISAIRGTHDILPGEIAKWQFVERVAHQLCERYGYLEIRTPVIEREELFAKGTGETTDIVQKEMYSFTDKGGERVTLRPEATPSMVRAYVEHSLEQALPSAKLYAMGPMFRYERPQKGRYRQFHQLDVEVFGLNDPAIDAEVIDLAWSLVDGPRHQARRARHQLGRLREPAGRSSQRRCSRRSATICRSSARTASGARRPIRCASTTARCRPISRSSIGCRTRSTISTSRARRTLPASRRTSTRSAFRGGVSHRLVRGLDYYTRTTFEILGAVAHAGDPDESESLGAQNALLGGGRYDGLVKDLGGPDRPGIGFAAGLERLVLALPHDAEDRPARRSRASSRSATTAGPRR